MDRQRPHLGGSSVKMDAGYIYRLLLQGDIRV